MPGERNDPYTAFNFEVDIGGSSGAFSEAGGLTSETDPIEYRDGTDEPHVRKLVGLNKVTNISLKRGIVDMGLWDWRQKVLDRQTERRDGTIFLLDEAGEKVVKWEFTAGWPNKWEGPSLNAKNNEVAIETLEICCETLKMSKM